MVFVTKSGPSLCISPWKDGLKAKDVLSNCPNILNILIVFSEENNNEDILDDSDLINLFTLIGNNFPKLMSVTISLQSSDPPSRQLSRQQTRLTPPLKAMNALLNGNNRLQRLTLVQLKLTGTDSEMKDLFTSVRIHPTLQNFDAKACFFSKESHLKDLKASLDSRPMMRHVVLDGSIIVESLNAISKTEEEMLSYPILCCF